MAVTHGSPAARARWTNERKGRKSVHKQRDPALSLESHKNRQTLTRNTETYSHRKCKGEAPGAVGASLDERAGRGSPWKEPGS